MDAAAKRGYMGRQGWLAMVTHPSAPVLLQETIVPAGHNTLLMGLWAAKDGAAQSSRDSEQDLKMR